MPDYAMKGENSDKFRVSAFSFSLLSRHFPEIYSNKGIYVSKILFYWRLINIPICIWITVKNGVNIIVRISHNIMSICT